MSNGGVPAAAVLEEVLAAAGGVHHGGVVVPRGGGRLPGPVARGGEEAEAEEALALPHHEEPQDLEDQGQRCGWTDRRSTE